MLERFRTNNPKSEFTADVTRKLAVAYGETGQAGQAAVEFERIALNPAETKDIQREANLQAADLYAKAGNTTKAVGMLERFVVTYPTPVADSIEARQKLADIAGTAGNVEKQRSWQREIVTADRNAGAGRTDRTQYLAAKSQLALAIAGARRVPQHPAGAAAQDQPREEAQGDGSGARRIQGRRGLSRGRSHDASPPTRSPRSTASSARTS